MNTSTVLEQSAPGADGSAESFGALSDPARLAILRELQTGTTCVCELAPRLRMAPNLLSYHLRILREAGLVEGTRRGRRIEYRVRRSVIRDLVVELLRLATWEPDEG